VRAPGVPVLLRFRPSGPGHVRRRCPSSAVNGVTLPYHLMVRQRHTIDGRAWASSMTNGKWSRAQCRSDGGAVVSSIGSVAHVAEVPGFHAPARSFAVISAHGQASQGQRPHRPRRSGHGQTRRRENPSRDRRGNDGPPCRARNRQAPHPSRHRRGRDSAFRLGRQRQPCSGCRRLLRSATSKRRSTRFRRRRWRSGGELAQIALAWRRRCWR